jgi:collagenase-like PrtC family protease
MKYFSLPADFKHSTLDRYQELNHRYKDSKIVETYGQVTAGTVLNSGRVTDVLPEVDFRGLEQYVKYSTDRDMEFDYTLNPACFGNLEFSPQGIRRIQRLLERLYNMGVSWLTVSSPSLIELVRASGLKFRMKASALCEITSPGKALFYKKSGMERMVVDPDVTRDFRVLRNICKVFGDGVEIIINNVCYKNCPYKMFHYNHEAHRTPANTSQTITEYYFNRCSLQKAGSIENPIRLNWIRPEDLHFYKEVGISHLKVQGRQNVLQGDVVKALTQYIEEDYDGNLFDLITIFAPYNAFQPYIDNKKLDGFVQRFFDHPDCCQNVCDSCHYCLDYAKKSMDTEKAAEINRQALEFYQKYDEYTKAIHTSEKENVKVKKLFAAQELNLEYDF